MPRKPRLEAPGLIYHIMGRGIEKRSIYADQQDRDDFLVRFGQALIDTDTECLAFCLMPNHFHLLLRSGQVPISTCMRRLLTGYAVNFNKRHDRVGHLFQNRYKSIICQEETYLLELIRYIHLNPIRAGLVNSLSELQCSRSTGHGAILGRTKHNWYPPEPTLAYFGSSNTTARRNYMEFLKDGLAIKSDPVFTGGGLRRSLRHPVTDPKDRQAHDDRILGDNNFVLRLQQLEKADRAGAYTSSMEALINNAATACGFEASELAGKGATKKLIETRSIVAHLAVRYLGLSYAQIGRHLHAHRASAARMAAKGSELSAGKDVKQWLEQ